MIFTELVLNNFGAYAGRHVINLRPENNGTMHPIILFGGMNGGGKTTLMDAIRLALYGQRAKCSGRGNLGYGDFLTQLVNRQTLPEQTTEIELSFESIFDNHWQTFKITRAWKRYPAEGKDSISIIRQDGYDSNLQENWDEYIESILPLGISNLFLFDGEQVKELAELDAPPPSVVDAINSLLGLELAEKLAVDLEVLASRKRKDLASKAQLATIEEIEAKIKEKEKAEKIAFDKVISLEDRLKKAHQKSDRASSKFRTEGGKIAAERSSLEEQKNNLIAQQKKQQEQLRILAAKTLPLGLIDNLLADAEVTGKQELKIQQFKQAQSLIDERDEKLLAYLKDIGTSEEYNTKVQFFIEEENKSLENTINSHGSAYLEITEDEFQQFISISKNKLSLQQKQAKDILNELQQISNEMDAIDKQLTLAASPEEYDKLQKAKDRAVQAVSQCKSDLDLAKTQKNQLTLEIEKAKKELKNYSQKIIDSDNNQHIVNSITKVQKTLELFKEKLTLKKLNKLENEITECFRYLLYKSNLVYKVVVDSDSFSLSLYDPQGKLLPKQRLSAGEKQLLAIAFLWGLARVSGKKLPIAIDTPLGRLDSSHRTNLIERYFPSASHQVILLSTDTEIGEKEIVTLREQEAIAREYLLEYNADNGHTTVNSGYFW
ncbi:DNA sulfur modification protein DndD [Hyella patelloides LEGE 07179]|uniref:Nuclease SbcCD subunit C n=1 Tax=Hyella patelloides LEGE 07179 TaxID=945734 RepID=A0A563W4S8_9CYAN|nr:DNA sulfur modification protein DndD [Hyella patelloides]VEP18688.1 DNA sulfur modification protein DndD [Hyella patelloides LEGE 07179]